MKGALDLLSRTTAERIRHELYLILAEEEPERAIKRLADLGILDRIAPAVRADEWFLSRARLLRQAVTHGSRLPADMPAVTNGMSFHLPETSDLPGCYLALLVCRLPAEELQSFLKRLRVMREDATLARQLNKLWQAQQKLAGDRLRNSQIYEILHGYDEPTLFLFYVVSDSWLVRQRIELYQRRLKDMSPLVDGHALKAIGVAPGPIYRQIIDRLRTAWLDGEIADEEDEGRLLEELLNKMNGAESAGV